LDGPIAPNWNLENSQDTSRYDSKQQSAGVSASVCVPPLCAGGSNIAGNIGQQKLNSDYASVIEQTGIRAGILHCSFGLWISGFFSAISGWNPGITFQEQKEAFFDLLRQLLDQRTIKFCPPNEFWHEGYNVLDADTETILSLQGIGRNLAIGCASSPVSWAVGVSRPGSFQSSLQQLGQTHEQDRKLAVRASHHYP
jgi:hypothetical protein